jgi:hypothetical protein
VLCVEAKYIAEYGLFFHALCGVRLRVSPATSKAAHIHLLEARFGLMSPCCKVLTLVSHPYVCTERIWDQDNLVAISL